MQQGSIFFLFPAKMQQYVTGFHYSPLLEATNTRSVSFVLSLSLCTKSFSELILISGYELCPTESWAFLFNNNLCLPFLLAFRTFSICDGDKSYFCSCWTMVCVSGILSSVSFLFLLAWSESSDERVKVISLAVDLHFFPLILFLIPVSLAFFDFDVEINGTRLAND